MSESSIPSLQPPRGMRDFYPEDADRRRRIFDAWRAAAWSGGFREYDACVVESLDLLKRKAGEEIVEQIYFFQDKSGRDLALRPEMTPTLARMIAARQGALTFPVRWFTIAQCFRYERTTRGRKREHYQWNLDIVGSDSPAAEVEVLSAAAAALTAFGLKETTVRVRFSSRALLAELLLSLGVPPAHHAAAFLALDKRGKLPDDEIRALLAKEGVDAAAVPRIFDLLALRTLPDVAARLAPDSAPLAVVREFLRLAEAAGIAGWLDFDLSVIRGLAYYTGIVFEAFDAAGEFRALFGGGRYDNLLASVGGAPHTGVGLGFGDVVVCELMERLGLPLDDPRPARVQVGFMAPEQHAPALKLSVALRRDGASVETALRPEPARDFFGRAAKSGSAEAAYIGPDDIARGEARIKNLATREQRTVPLPQG